MSEMGPFRPIQSVWTPTDVRFAPKATELLRRHEVGSPHGAKRNAGCLSAKLPRISLRSSGLQIRSDALLLVLLVLVVVFLVVVLVVLLVVLLILVGVFLL